MSSNNTSENGNHRLGIPTTPNNQPTSPLTKPTSAHSHHQHSHQHSHSHHPPPTSLHLPQSSVFPGSIPSNPNTNASNSQSSSRKPSVVELLSSPPPLPANYSFADDQLLSSFSLSRNASVSSRVSASNTSASGIVQGIDWTEIPLSELTSLNKLILINNSYSIQDAFKTLDSNSLTSVPVLINPTSPQDLTNCLTFDYSDLNTYLLLIMNKITLAQLATNELYSDKDPREKQEIIANLIAKAKRGEPVPVDFIVKLHPKNPFLKFLELDTLFKIVEAMGNGQHRIAIHNPRKPEEITGILSQRRLIKYMWENARRFPGLQLIFNLTLQELKIGLTTPITIYDDQLLIDALYKMFEYRVSSLAVIDKLKMLVGNISIVDVKNVTSSQKSHLLFKSVLNFISYNLSQKGIEKGQDQFPIFHVNPNTSLARVIAKLVATQSHRLWIVELTARNSISTMPCLSAPDTPILTPTSASAQLAAATVESLLQHQQQQLQAQNSAPTLSSPHASPQTQQPPSTPNTNTTSLNEVGSISSNGRLVGVVSLTDILGVFANSKGTKTDPQFARNQRRRSSTSTTRSSIERSSIEILR
ncbi:cell separation during budding [Scheffersomyces spartinae]|uniref:Cell separation during budding n=1 Tax=Scheffersomyces spartinae TaxID=45513 RepID=A0A9P7V8P0_9ASCO|nr:cell separation during budding [Scheffersomyces spartinae]KAG7193465.1 cell separation during budding [Scheffersomyces spartinae]